MNNVTFGAGGPTGQLLTRQALEERHTVTAVTRRPAEGASLTWAQFALPRPSTYRTQQQPALPITAA
jgi:uncharacterized protein YbjT (DUF2867 family)